MPNQNAVISITSSCDMQRVLDIIWEILLPALGENNAPHEGKAAAGELLGAQKGLSHLKINANAPSFPKIRGEYKTPDGSFRLYLDINETDGVIAVTNENTKNTSVFRFKKDEWLEGATHSFYLPYNPFVKIGAFMRNVTYAEWNPGENTLDVTAWFYETPVKNSAKLKFCETMADLKLTFDNGQSFGLEFVKGSNLRIVV
jgi:hypothetical protein